MWLILYHAAHRSKLCKVVIDIFIFLYVFLVSIVFYFKKNVLCIGIFFPIIKIFIDFICFVYSLIYFIL